jgi:predicted O-methyltransferase YrrM
MNSIEEKNMNSLQSPIVSGVLTPLFAESEKGEAAIKERLARSGMNIEDAIRHMVSKAIETEKSGIEKLNDRAEDYFAVSRDFGRFLYAIARASKARRIVEFGTSMGVSTVHLAAAVKDNGGGEVIGTEYVASKAQRARANLEAAGLVDLVNIQVGDARQTLRNIDGEIDMILLDGAFTHYLEILKLLEPRLKSGAVILAENAFKEADGYISYIHNPANGYVALTLPINVGRGNEFAVRTM